MSLMNRLRNCRDHLEMVIPPLPWARPRWRKRSGPPVVLLHGLWRSWHAMQPLARALEREGFSTYNLPYPSMLQPIPALTDRIRNQIASIARDEPVHIVGHSLGGIIARSLLAESVPWKPGRLVMLAPPNCGSEIVDWSKNHPVLRSLLGPAGRELGSDGFPKSLPQLPQNAEVAVIMGRRSLLPFFRHLLEPDNDGIVSASRGKIAGIRGFAVLDADHTFIQLHPEAIRLTAEFLKTGAWPAESSGTIISAVR